MALQILDSKNANLVHAEPTAFDDCSLPSIHRCAFHSSRDKKPEMNSKHNAGPIRRETIYAHLPQKRLGEKTHKPYDTYKTTTIRVHLTTTING